MELLAWSGGSSSHQLRVLYLQQRRIVTSPANHRPPLCHVTSADQSQASGGVLSTIMRITRCSRAGQHCTLLLGTMFGTVRILTRLDLQIIRGTQAGPTGP